MGACLTMERFVISISVTPQGRSKSSLSIPFYVSSNAAKQNIPLTFSIPLPMGTCTTAEKWTVNWSGSKTSSPVQSRVLSCWPDGSVKWLLVTMPRSEHQRESGLDGHIVPDMRPQDVCVDKFKPTVVPLRMIKTTDGINIATQLTEFAVDHGDILLRETTAQDSWFAPKACRLIAVDAKGKRHVARTGSIEIVEAGPLRTQLRIRGIVCKGVRFVGEISFFAESGKVRIDMTVHNPRRARHSGGLWDLGDPGSVQLRQLSVELATGFDLRRKIMWMNHNDSVVRQTSGAELRVHQESSGGVNWQSRSHVNRGGRVPLKYRGYRVVTSSGEERGYRASPTVALASPGKHVAVALEEFWQKFPSAIEVQGETILVHLWPDCGNERYELQAGERNTRTLWIEVGNGKQPCQRLSAIHGFEKVRLDPDWIATSSVIPFFPSTMSCPRESFEQAAEEMLAEETGFFAKREAIDEFGWRNYGDFWADHEETYAVDPRPVISHYNNQYDLLHSLLVQYLQTGDSRWWQLAEPLAQHVLNIDMYHTTKDKPAYNGGMFWHTAHYHDAATSSHRSYSRSMQGNSIPAGGGGPSNEHCYSSGLLLYHFLSGNERAREAVIQLGNWVIAMDDGRQHVCGLVSEAPTGLASCTRELDYQGPGRGAGNAILALLNAWNLTSEIKFLAKAKELILRTIHPADDVGAKQLLVAEERWSYTVYLQSLVWFVEATKGLVGCVYINTYARQSLLQYARWMCIHERPYLSRSEELEYPTETWAAQDLRKGVVLLMAAQYADGEPARYRGQRPERELFQKRGEQIIDQAWSSLRQFSTRTCTRPSAIVLQQGYLERYFRGKCDVGTFHSEISNNPSVEFGEPNRFTPQKTLLKQEMKSLRHALKLALRLLMSNNWAIQLKRSWAAESLRILVSRDQ